MRVVNVKELKSRLSSYLRAAHAGEIFAVTDRGRVVARLGPAEFGQGTTMGVADPMVKLVALGVRPPLRERRPNDYRRVDPPSGLTTVRIDALLAEARDETR